MTSRLVSHDQLIGLEVVAFSAAWILSGSVAGAVGSIESRKNPALRAAVVEIVTALFSCTSRCQKGRRSGGRGEGRAVEDACTVCRPSEQRGIGEAALLASHRGL